MRLLITYADGRKVKQRVALAEADHYEPRTAEVFLASADIQRIQVQFRHKSGAMTRVFVDDVTLLLSRALP